VFTNIGITDEVGGAVSVDGWRTFFFSARRRSWFWLFLTRPVASWTSDQGDRVDTGYPSDRDEAVAGRHILFRRTLTKQGTDVGLVPMMELAAIIAMNQRATCANLVPL
jgi:hypothetical protein